MRPEQDFKKKILPNEATAVFFMLLITTPGPEGLQIRNYFEDMVSVCEYIQLM